MQDDDQLNVLKCQSINTETAKLAKLLREFCRDDNSVNAQMSLRITQIGFHLEYCKKLCAYFSLPR
jgi:uncharacterized protein YutD